MRNIKITGDLVYMKREGKTPLVSWDKGDTDEIMNLREPTRITFDTNGGKLVAGTCLRGAIMHAERSGATIFNHATRCASAATYGFLAVPKERRSADNDVTFMIHNVTGESRGNKKKHAESVELYTELDNQLVKFYDDALELGEAKITNLMEDETRMNYSDLVQNNIIGSDIDGLENLDNKADFNIFTMGEELMEVKETSKDDDEEDW